MNNNIGATSPALEKRLAERLQELMAEKTAEIYKSESFQTALKTALENKQSSFSSNVNIDLPSETVMLSELKTEAAVEKGELLYCVRIASAAIIVCIITLILSHFWIEDHVIKETGQTAGVTFSILFTVWLIFWLFPAWLRHTKNYGMLPA